MATTAADLQAVNDSTRMANTETVLTPRFYTTDFDAMNAMDFSPVREEWDALMAEFENDTNKNHFKRDEQFKNEIRKLSPELYDEFIGFLVSSATSEYSGCALYADIKKAVDNPDMKKAMAYMARDEARHASFINRSLEDFGRPVDLNFLRRKKKYTFFKPKYILYATYLSEKIGYARYIRIFRQLEKHPDRRFHPIFRWFERWCNDEFRHGEVFALMMKADPKLTRGRNLLWIRFFLLAVFSTMYVRDHQRPAMHEAFGVTPGEYDRDVLQITSEISKQIFPFTLNLDDPRMWRGFDRLREISDKTDAARERGGVVGGLRKVGYSVAAAGVFLRLFMLPVRRHSKPAQTRLAPSW
ncbi:MAG: magnesium-protoporphyrin IX monomethyl ester (oxidative) cyclase [Pseudomonadota bacterium]